MATTYPKCSPTEMLGLLVLLNDHKGSEDVALLADDLDLEIDEIFPSLEYAQHLQLLKVTEGRATFTELGKKLVDASIRERKTIVREQLKKTPLFRTILRALEASPSGTLDDEEFGHIISFTTAKADGGEQNIVNWGRYADLFRYDADAHTICPARRSVAARTGGGKGAPPAGGTGAAAPVERPTGRTGPSESPGGPGTVSAVA